MENLFAPNTLGKIFAILCAIFWAFAVILFNKSGKRIKPLALNFYKSLVSAILLIPVLILTKNAFFPLEATYEDYFLLIGSGVLGVAFSDTFFFKSLNLLGAGLTAIVDCLYSPMIVFLSCLILKNSMTFDEILGGLMIISAIFIGLFKSEDMAGEYKKKMLGLFYGFISMLFMGLSVVLMKPVLDKFSSLWVIEVRYIFGLIVLFFMILFNKDRSKLFSSLSDRENMKDAFGGTFLGSFLAVILWASAFKLTSLNSAAILNQTNTIFIIIFASIFLKEKLTLRKGIASILGVIGSLIVMVGIKYFLPFINF